ncbi:MAG TPA: hypothetical protein VI699_05210, partial [Candidatus Acidoferrales bacterium]|nr:hypothetical protein [Candidatus Acidoferrales bacterium]
QVVVTGRADDSRARALEEAAAGVYRLGKAVLRVTPEVAATDGLASSLKQILPGLRADIAQALVCVETTCQPPTSDPETLRALLTELPAGAASV